MNTVLIIDYSHLREIFNPKVRTFDKSTDLTSIQNIPKVIIRNQT